MPRPKTPLSRTIPDSQPLVIGHRGASALAPENTLGAFLRALADGAHGVELDVRLARDGTPVVIHDATLRRTSLSDGVVAEMTARELALKDVGSWFNRAYPRLARDEYAGEVVPTLDHVFFLFSACPISSAPASAVIYVEMKFDGAQDSVVDLAHAVVQLVNGHGLKNRIVVVSFNLDAISQIKKIDSTIRTGAVFEPKRNPVNLVRTQRMVAAAIDHGADEILLHRSMARSGAIRAAAGGNLPAVVWTVDDPKWMARARRLGIHALITNVPGVLVGESGSAR